MYNSQYYTCEQIDERLLQGYVDDYNTQTGQSLTKEQFLTKLGNVFAKETIIDNTAVNIGYFVCDTAAGTAAKAITAAGYKLFQGGSIKVKFTNRNTAGSATLNINSKGAKALYYGGKAVSASNSWDNGEVVEIYYDGTSYYANNVEGNFKDGIFDISAYNLTEGQPTKYDTLAEALGTNGNNVPPIFRKGGMQIKYISTYDNKYVQYRLTANSFTTDVRMWQEINSDRYVKNLTDIYDDKDIYGYITDEEQKVFAVIYKDGSIRKLVLTEEEIKVGELLGMVSSESIFYDENVLKYLTDENGTCFGFIKNDGTVFINRIGTDYIDNKIINMLSQESIYNDDNVLKYLTDEHGTCFGYIATDGTVVIYKAKIMNYDDEDASEKQFATIIGLLANGVDNIELSNNPKFMATLHNLLGKNTVINENNDNNLNLRPCLSLIDDDTIDGQIPSSSGSSTPATHTGGYFSLLLPFMLSLGSKHNKNLCPGLACEGQRVGFTPIRSSDDNYTELNENGRAVKWLHDNMRWNVLCHSMTAQLPMENTYYVDGIGSQLAQQIINENDAWYSPLAFHNCIVLDRVTGKWYELNTQSRYAWVERTPTKKYAMPFYKDYNTGQWYFNRDFDFKYSWGEWFKRANELGLPYEKVIVHNGGTSSVYMASAGRKYAYWSVRTSGTHNYPPIPATVNRISDGSGDNNVRNVSYEERLMSEIDYCYEHNTWMIFMSHFNDEKFHRNYYLDGETYPDGDPNYPSEWIVPLKYEEIQDIIGDNVHDYINHPPLRLNLNSWSEWHPAPGTQLMSLYNVIDYALTKGIDFVSPMEGWNTHGNVLNLGVDRNGQTYVYDSAANVVPYTDDEKSYLTIGADMSIRYYNSKNV